MPGALEATLCCDGPSRHHAILTGQLKAGAHPGTCMPFSTRNAIQIGNPGGFEAVPLPCFRGDGIDVVMGALLLAVTDFPGCKQK